MVKLRPSLSANKTQGSGRVSASDRTRPPPTAGGHAQGGATRGVGGASEDHPAWLALLWFRSSADPSRPRCHGAPAGDHVCPRSRSPSPPAARDPRGSVADFLCPSDISTCAHAQLAPHKAASFPHDGHASPTVGAPGDRLDLGQFRHPVLTPSGAGGRPHTWRSPHGTQGPSSPRAECLLGGPRPEPRPGPVRACCANDPFRR